MFLIVPLIIGEDKQKPSIMKEYKLTSTFCDFRGDHFHTGIDLAGKDKEIYSIMEGELVFYNIDRKRSINYGNGNFVIIENTNDNLRFNYSHLKDKSFDPQKINYNKGDKVAILGNSGHSTGPHLHFEIEDIKNERLLNPLEFIDIKDSISPRIIDIYFICKNNEKISLIKQRNRKIKRGGKLYIRCEDRIDGSNYSLSPYKITVIVDGIEKSNLMFNYLKKSNNRFVVAEDRNFEEIYTNRENFDYYIMNYFGLPGIIGLKVIIEDFVGNKAIFRSALRILLPEKKVNGE